MQHARFCNRVGARKKVAALLSLLSGLLLVTVLYSPAFASTGVVYLPSDFNRFVQVEFSDLAGISMTGQTLSIDFIFSNPLQVNESSLSTELFLQTGPNNSSGDYPYSQYVVFESGSQGYFVDENGNALLVPMADGRGGVTDSPAATMGVVATDRGWAGAGIIAYPRSERVAAIHFDLVLPNTGERLVVGRIAVRVQSNSESSTLNETIIAGVLAPPSIDTIPAEVFTPPSIETIPAEVFAPPSIETIPAEVFAPPSIETIPAEVFTPPSVETIPAEVLAPPSTSSERDVFISQVAIEDPTTSSALINWSTNATLTFVEFGTTTSYGQQAVPQFGAVENYSVRLSDLQVNTTYHFRIVARDQNGWVVSTQDQTFITDFDVPNLGGISRSIDGSNATSTGYGRIQSTAGTTPSGLAIFGNRQSNSLLSEFALPATSAMTSGRTYVEARSDGLVNTAIVIANPRGPDATIDFELRDAQGNIFRTGSFTVKGLGGGCDPSAICNQLSRTIDEAPFLGGRDIEGTLTFTSSTPVSVIAIRKFYNERSPGELLATNQPVVDLSSAAVRETQVVPHFTAGSGMKTELVLMNATGMRLHGKLEFLDPSGSPMVVKVVTHYTESLRYNIAPNSTEKLVVSEGAMPWQIGSVWIIPDEDDPAPTPFAIVGHKPQEATVAETGIPVTMGTAFRLYTQITNSPHINTSVTVANATDRPGTVTFSLTDLDGRFVGGGSLPLSSRGQITGTVDSLIPSLSDASVRGILRITTDLARISVVGLRSRYNERQPVPELVFTSIVPALENVTPTFEERIFPQLGQGFPMEVILYSGSAWDSSQGSLSFVRSDGVTFTPDIH